MADPVVPTPPPAPQLPPFWPVVLAFFLSFLQSTWLRVLVTILITLYLTVWTLKATFGMVIPDFRGPVLPHILPKPRKAEDAIGRITFGNVGCTGTIVGPVFSNDATLEILTAAHCVKVGAVGKMALKDGRFLSVKCVSRDPASDAAWLTADHPGGDVPYLLLADQPPQDGEIVWHQGYGIDRPGNRESGLFRGMTPGSQQCKFRLSVSPGDSGGGIILDSDSRVISPVCCTTKLSGTGDVWGASPLAAAKIRPRHTVSDEEPPKIWPVLPLPPEVMHGYTSKMHPPPVRPPPEK